MPFNLTKKYPTLLELNHLSDFDRINSLKGIFNRDIAENSNFSFRGKKIYPIKSEGVIDMEREFKHLTCKEVVEESEGKKFPKRIYDSFRSERLHWIRTHIEEKVNDSVFEVFSTIERDQRKRKDVYRTYVYNVTRKYVVVLEPQFRGSQAYYLLSAYYLNESYGEKQMKQKLSNKLDVVY